MFMVTGGRAELLERQYSGLTAGGAQLEALQVRRRDDRPDVVRDVAKADLAEAQHLQIGARAH